MRANESEGCVGDEQTGEYCVGVGTGQRAMAAGNGCDVVRRGAGRAGRKAVLKCV